MAQKNIQIQVSVQSKNVQAQLQQINRQLRSLSASANQGEKSMRRLGNGMKFSLSQLSALSAGFIGLSSAFRVLGFGINQMVQFESAMASVSAISGETGVTFDAMTAKARKLGATTMFSATQAAEGLKFLSMAGFTANQSMASLETTLKLAQAGTMDLGRSADIMSNIMTAMNISAEKSAKTGDILAVAMANSNTSIEQLGDAFKYAGGIAGAMGLTLEETTAALSTLSNAGLQASMAGTGLRQVLTKLANPSAAMREVFSSVGIEVENLDLSSGNLGKTLRTLASAGLTTGEIFKAFEARAGTAFTVLASGMDTFDELESKNQNANGTLDEMANIMEDTLLGSLKMLQSAFSELMISQSGFGGAIRESVDTLTAFIQVIGGTATSTDKFGNSTDELVKRANKLKIILQAVGVVIGGIIVGKMAVMVAQMGGAIARTVALTGATMAQNKALMVQQGLMGGHLTKFISMLATGIISMFGLAGATGTASVAMRGLAVAIASTGLGAIAVVIGFIIGKIVEWASTSSATADQAIGDTRKIRGELDELNSAYEMITKEVAGGANNQNKRIKEIISNYKVLGKTADQTREMLNPPKQTNFADLKSLEQLGDSIKATENKIQALNKARRSLYEGSEELAENDEALEIAQAQLEFYKSQGQEIVRLREEEAMREKNLQVVTERITENLRALEEFHAEMRKTENAEISASIDVSQAERRFQRDIVAMGDKSGTLAGQITGNNLRDEIQQEVNNADFDSMGKIKAGLQVAVDEGRLIADKDALAQFDQTVNATRERLLSLAGGAENASDKVKQAIERFALMDAVQGVTERTDIGGQGMFSTIRDELKETAENIDDFEQKMNKLKEIQELQATIAFQNESKNELAKIEAEIAKAKLETMSMEAEFDNASKTSNKLGSTVKTLATILNDMGATTGEDLTDVTSFDLDKLKEMEDFVDTEDGLNKRRIASALRAFSAIEALQQNRQALEGNQEDFAFTLDPRIFDSGAKALKQTLISNANDGAKAIEDILQLGVLAGLGETKGEVEQMLKGAEGKELEDLFQALVSKVERVRAEAVKLGMSEDEIAKKALDILNLERERLKVLEEQEEKLRKQQTIVENITKAQNIQAMEVGVRFGDEGVDQGDIDMAKTMMKAEKDLESFKAKLKKSLEQEADIKIALERSKINEGDGDKLDKERALAEFRNKLEQENLKTYEELLKKQEEIQGKATLADQIDIALKSFEKEMEKFKKEREERQDQAEDFAQQAVKDQGMDKEGKDVVASSLASIGGGGGVALGEDPQAELADLNKAQLNVLEDIAKNIFKAEDLNALDPEDRTELVAMTKQLQQMVNEGKIGPDEALKALKNAAQLRAQRKEDKELEKVGKVKDLANLGQDAINQQAPQAEENKQLQKLGEKFDNLDKEGREQVIQKLEKDKAPQEVIDMFKNRGQAIEDREEAEKNKKTPEEIAEIRSKQQDKFVEEALKANPEIMKQDTPLQKQIEGIENIINKVGLKDKGAIAEKIKQQLGQQGELPAELAMENLGIGEPEPTELPNRQQLFDFADAPEVQGLDGFDFGGGIVDPQELEPPPLPELPPLPTAEDLANLPQLEGDFANILDTGELPPLPDMSNFGKFEPVNRVADAGAGDLPPLDPDPFVAPPLFEDIDPAPDAEAQNPIRKFVDNAGLKMLEGFAPEQMPFNKHVEMDAEGNRFSKFTGQQLADDEIVGDDGSILGSLGKVDPRTGGISKMSEEEQKKFDFAMMNKGKAIGKGKEQETVNLADQQLKAQLKANRLLSVIATKVGVSGDGLEGEEI